MPRRARPSYRLPPSKGTKVKQLENVLSKPKHQLKTRYVETDVDSEDEATLNQDPFGEEFEQGSSQWSESRELEDGDDTDAPRVSVWAEDNEDFFARQDVDLGNKITDANRLQNGTKIYATRKRLTGILSDLQNLPLGALRRAQKLLEQAVAESESDISPDELPTQARILKREKEKVEWSTKPVNDVGRRNKHAPVEMTAKKPVTRNRIVVDVPKIVPRDPRFLQTAGRFDPKQFQQSYGFLAESRKAELEVLRESLMGARKMVASSPRALRSEREEEVERLERAMKRAESMVHRDRMARVEQEALSKTKKEEMEQRKQGKGRWFLKKGDEKELVMKARYEMLAKEGGQRAVKKAMEKRQKKNSQKEKRSRPYDEERPKKRARA